MADITIKAHTRRGKGGKTIQVHSYSRRIGRKGVRSPKKEKSDQPGEELERLVAAKEERPAVTLEDIQNKREYDEGLKKAMKEMRSLGLTKEQYSRYKMSGKERPVGKAGSSSPRTSSPLSPRGSMGIFEKVEDKVAKFVEKYSGKKYKRSL